MKTRTKVRAGATSFQHNRGVKVRTAVKSGATNPQHNRGVKVKKSRVRAGALITEVGFPA
jgi:hypothetical protein